MKAKIIELETNRKIENFRNLSMGNADFNKGSTVTPNVFMACIGALFLTFQLLSFTQNIAGRNREVGVRVATGCHSGNGFPVGARFFASFQTDSRADSAFYTMNAVSYPGINWPGHGVNNPTHLTPRLKKV